MTPSLLLSILAPAPGTPGDAELVPELYAGMKFAYRERRFKITQICGETVYVKLASCDWDAPVPRARVLAAVMSHRSNYEAPA